MIVDAAHTLDCVGGDSLVKPLDVFFKLRRNIVFLNVIGFRFHGGEYDRKKLAGVVVKPTTLLFVALDSLIRA